MRSTVLGTPPYLAGSSLKEKALLRQLVSGLREFCRVIKGAKAPFGCSDVGQHRARMAPSTGTIQVSHWGCGPPKRSDGPLRKPITSESGLSNAVKFTP